MLLFQNDAQQGILHGTQLGLALVAGGQTNRMQVSFTMMAAITMWRHSACAW